MKALQIAADFMLALIFSAVELALIVAMALGLLFLAGIAV